MTDRFDALAPTPPNKDGKSFLRRIGVAWPMKNGPGYRVVLEAAPLPVLNEGKLETVILLMPPKEQPSGGSAPDPDSVPF